MNKLLAWYQYPEPKGKAYFAEDLIHSDKVIEVFDYCQILLAYITKEGWNFLIEHYGYYKLFELSNMSGWKDCESLSEYKSAIEYEMSITAE